METVEIARSAFEPSTSAERQSPAATNRMLLIGFAGAMLFQIFLLIVVGWHNRQMINYDAIFYMRIASYYANLQFDLAVNGYWGPLFSWLMIPLLSIFENPIDAARIVMALSAVIFLIGSISVFHSFEIHPAGKILGAWITAVVSAAWTVKITPDLLVSGFICLAVAQMASNKWIEKRNAQIAAGVFWGLAYFAKPVAFPLAIIISSVIAALWAIGHENKKNILRSLAITLIAFLAMTSVWILILSLKYGGVVISTSGKINHAIVGPRDVERLHPHNVTFHVPEARRISSAEDPTNMPYKFWSPFESAAYAKHQWALICFNAREIVATLSGFSVSGLGAFAILFGLFVHSPWLQNMKAARWRWSGAIVACLAGIYLPVYAEQARYFYVTYPFLFAATFGLIAWLASTSDDRLSWPLLTGFIIVTICFAMPAREELRQAFITSEDERYVERGRYIAEKLKANHLQGPIAGDHGLYIAFYTNHPWYGAEPNATVERFVASKAKLAVITRGEQELVDQFKQAAAFVDLDSVLFDTHKPADRFPLKVYLRADSAGSQNSP
jgi:hypothetical protein